MFCLSQKTLQSYETVKPAYKRIYLTLKRAIEIGEINADDKLPEELLAKQLGSSRTPVRRALDTLRKEGLLEELVLANNSNLMSKKEMKHLLEYDAILEANGASLAASNGVSSEAIKLLHELNESMRNINNSLDSKDFSQKALRGIRDAHLQFHLLIAKLSKNPYIYKGVSKSRMQLRQYTSDHPFPLNETPYICYRYIFASCHDEIIKAIEEGEANTAYCLMYSDVKNAKKVYINSNI